MAESGVYKSSVSTGSDVLVECPCVPCKREDRTVESVKFCVECNERLCSACIQLHKRFATTKDHQIIDQSKVGQTQKRSQTSFTETCSKHPAKVIETFCQDHGQLCCSVCVSVSHRTCVDVIALPEAAEGIGNSQKLREILTRISKIEKKLKSLRKIRQDDNYSVKKERKEAIQNVKEHRIRIIAELDRLEKDFYAEMDAKANRCARSTAKDIGVCDDLLLGLDGVTKSIQTATADKDEVKIFVNIKKATDKCNESECNCATISKNKYSYLKYNIDSRAETFFKETHRLGNVEKGNRDVKIGGLLGHYDAKIKTDKQIPSIHGKALLRNGHIVFADYINTNLKIVDESVNVIHTIALSSPPSDVCIVSEEVVCVSHQSEKMIVFVTLDNTKTALKPIFVGKICRGLAYSDNELFVACENGGDAEVRVYSTDGKLIRSIGKDNNGRSLLKHPYYVTTNKDGSRIHVADNTNGIITLDKYGKLIWFYNKQDVHGAWDVCVDLNDNLYVCVFNSNKVVKICADGQSSEVVLTQKTGLQPSPVTVCYDDINDRLLITHYNGVISVFEMK